MSQLRTLLNNVIKTLAGVSFLAMVVLTCWQVFTRYVLKNSSIWSEELVSFLFAWMSLLGASLVVGERGHMNIPVLIERFNHKAQIFFAILSEVVACVFAAVILVFGGVQITTLAMGQMTSSLGVAIGIFYIILPLSGAINIVYTILNIIGILKGNINVLPVSEDKKRAKDVSKGV